jgi:hypothetical protein
MPSRAQRQLAQQARGLSLAVPQVIAHRVGRMATSGPRPNFRDRKELRLMGTEKMAAFFESWAAMGWAAVRAQQSMWRAAMVMPWSKVVLPDANTLAKHTLNVLSQGMAPVHRRAVSNARRLNRGKK